MGTDPSRHTYTRMPDGSPVMSVGRCAACGSSGQWHTDDHCTNALCGVSIYDQPGGSPCQPDHDPDARAAALQRHAAEAHADWQCAAEEQATLEEDDTSKRAGSGRGGQPGAEKAAGGVGESRSRTGHGERQPPRGGGAAVRRIGKRLVRPGSRGLLEAARAGGAVVAGAAAPGGGGGPLEAAARLTAATGRLAGGGAVLTALLAWHGARRVIRWIVKGGGQGAELAAADRATAPEFAPAAPKGGVHLGPATGAAPSAAERVRAELRAMDEREDRGARLRRRGHRRGPALIASGEGRGID